MPQIEPVAESPPFPQFSPGDVEEDPVASPEIDALQAEVDALELVMESRSGLPSNVRPVTSATAAVANDLILANATGGAFAVTLPAGVAGDAVIVMKVDASVNAVAVSGTINGDAGGASLTGRWAIGLFECTAPGTWILVNPAGADGTDGQDGDDGAPGDDGRTVLTTSGAPSNGIGVDGDYAYDQAAKIMYGPKAAGAWPAGVSLAGSNGAISQIEDEGTPLTVRSTINFVGAAVSAADTGGKTVVTVASASPSYAKFRSSRYYGPPMYGANPAPAAMTGNRLYAVPFFAGDGQAFDRLGVEVTTAAASAVIRLGIYNDSGGQPVTLLVDAGTVDASSTGWKEATIAQTLTGWVWLAVVEQVTNAVAARFINNTPQGLYLGPIGQSDPTTYNVAQVAYFGVAVTGALPGTFVNSGSITAAPLPKLRAA